MRDDDRFEFIVVSLLGFGAGALTGVLWCLRH